MWDICFGYLFWDTFSNHILIIKRYPTISYHILSYPFISFHILSYPKISSGANSQMKAQVRLAAAVRLRIAVALELVAGKVRALLDTVRMLVGTAPVTVRAHPAWVRSHDLAAGIGSHHACGRMGAASVLGRLGFRTKGPAQAPPSGRRKGGPAGWTQSPGTTSPTA